MQLDTSIRCQVCGRSTRQIAVEAKCLQAALALLTLDEPGPRWDKQPFERAYRTALKSITPDCYLCGEVMGDDVGHADHVDPRAVGGTNHWSNIGMTHKQCNLSKGDRPGITTEQNDRLTVQHERVQNAADQLDIGVWLQWIALQVKDQHEIPNVGTPYLMRAFVDRWFEDDWFAPPPWTVNTFLSLADDPGFLRDSDSLRRAGSVVDAWGRGEYRLSRRGPGRRRRRIDSNPQGSQRAGAIRGRSESPASTKPTGWPWLLRWFGRAP